MNAPRKSALEEIAKCFEEAGKCLCGLGCLLPMVLVAYVLFWKGCHS